MLSENGAVLRFANISIEAWLFNYAKGSNISTFYVLYLLLIFYSSWSGINELSTDSIYLGGWYLDDFLNWIKQGVSNGNLSS